MRYGRIRPETAIGPAVLGVVGLFLCGPWLSAGVAAEEFRIVNRVYVGNEKEPKVTSTTLFHERTVYDFLESPAEITIFDPDRDRFILLNTEKKIKTELTTNEVARFAERLQQWAKEHPSPFLRFMGSPRFEEKINDVSRELEFDSPFVTYQIVAEDAKDPGIADQYREFSDWLAKLNTLLNPGAYPPHARMLVNSILAKRHEVPAEVRLTMRTKGRLQLRPVTFQSKHHLVRRLVESDRRRIAQVAEYLSMFSSVSFNEYQKACREGEKE